MKYLLTFLTVIAVNFTGHAQNIAGSKLKEEALGRCTGSAYCSACRNCSRCAHCGSGGSCGVCAPSSSSSDYYPVKRNGSKKKVRRSNYTTKRDNSTASSLSNQLATRQPPIQYLYVATDQLSLRSGPGTNYPVIEKLMRNQRISLISRHGQWTKIKVAGSGKIGYCSASYLR